MYCIFVGFRTPGRRSSMTSFLHKTGDAHLADHVEHGSSKLKKTRGNQQAQPNYDYGSVNVEVATALSLSRACSE